MCEYFYIVYIDFVLRGKSLLGYTNLFYPNDYGNNNSNNSKIFSLFEIMKILFCVICCNYRKFEKPKISYLLDKKFFLSIISNKTQNGDEIN